MMIRPLAVLAFSLVPLAQAQEKPAGAPVNTLSPAEKAAGWKLLFDGTSTSAWRGYKSDTFPGKGWSIDAGVLKTASGGGDIITKEQFEDFELVLEWKAADKANSGILYRVAETGDTAWQTGPEFQILEDSTYGVKPDDMHSAGALYDFIAPPKEKVLAGAGEWNRARIVCRRGVVQHYLNEVKLLECRIDDDAWKERIAKSKFKDYPGFGVQTKGHIGIQDHGDTLWYRNIKVRDLNAASPAEVSLFNGKDMGGWKAILPGGGKMEDVWSVGDAAIVCKGNPVGYIRTEKDYTNYVLKLEWRFSPVTKKAGNSGVLLRMVGEDKVWPKSVEAQLESTNAGDFWNIGDFKMKPDASRTNGRNTRKLASAENPVGEWNEYEIVVDHGNVTLWVNGRMLNSATEVEEIAGKIGLQSEGSEIHFRNIRLTPIP
jgi:hypothetical protein